MASIDYTARDFDTARTALRAHIEVTRPDLGASFDDINGLGGLLLDLIAYAMDVSANGTDVAVNELIPATAQNFNSLLRIATSEGLQPALGSPAVCDFSITVPDPGTGLLTAEVLKDTAFTDSRLVPWVIADDASIDVSAGESLLVFSARQVKPETRSFFVDGQPNVQLELPFVSNTRSTLLSTVVVTHTPSSDVWERVDTLANSAPDDLHYEIRTPNDRAVALIFGDGIHGTAPPAGNMVVAYESTRGVGGNAPTLSIPSLIYSRTFTSSNDTAVAPATSVTSATGGTNTSDLEILRNQVVRAQTTGTQLITRDDYARGAVSTGFATYATAVWAFSTDQALAVDLRTWAGTTDTIPVAVNRGSSVLTSAIVATVNPTLSRENILTYLADKSAVGIVATTPEAGLAYCDVYLRIVPVLGVVLADLRESVGTAVSSLFEQDALNVTVLSIVQAVEALTRVQQCTVIRTLESKEDWTPATGTVTFNAVPATGSTVTLYDSTGFPTVYEFTNGAGTVPDSIVVALGADATATADNFVSILGASPIVIGARTGTTVDLTARNLGTSYNQPIGISSAEIVSSGAMAGGANTASLVHLDRRLDPTVLNTVDDLYPPDTVAGTLNTTPQIAGVAPYLPLEDLQTYQDDPADIWNRSSIANNQFRYTAVDRPSSALRLRYVELTP